MLDVIIRNPKVVIFKGQARSAIFPGDSGVFEVLMFHKRLVSRLLKGSIQLDDKTFDVNRGIVRVDSNQIVAIVE